MNINELLKNPLQVEQWDDVTLGMVGSLVYDERQRRLSFKDLPMLLPEEAAMTRLNGITAYRKRVGGGLREAMEAYKRAKGQI